MSKVIDSTRPQPRLTPYSGPVEHVEAGSLVVGDRLAFAHTVAQVEEKRVHKHRHQEGVRFQTLHFVLSFPLLDIEPRSGYYESFEMVRKIVPS